MEFQDGRKGAQTLEKEVVMWDHWGVTSVKKGGKKSVNGNANGNSQTGPDKEKKGKGKETEQKIINIRKKKKWTRSR